MYRSLICMKRYGRIIVKKINKDGKNERKQEL